MTNYIVLWTSIELGRGSIQNSGPVVIYMGLLSLKVHTI